MVDDLANRVTDVLAGASKPMDLSELVAATGAEPATLKAALRALWRSGRIGATGPGRWAKQLVAPQTRGVCFWAR